MDGMTAARLLVNTEQQGIADYIFDKRIINHEAGWVVGCIQASKRLEQRPQTYELMEDINKVQAAGWDGVSVQYSEFNGAYWIVPFIYCTSREQSHIYNTLFGNCALAT
jgi:hypothetical protein